MGTATWTKEIADEIKSRLKSELELPRYKFVVQVVIGEQRGEGVRMGCRCFWDPDTDAYAEDTYRNDSLFCVAAAFGSYLYSAGGSGPTYIGLFAHGYVRARMYSSQHEHL